MKVVRNIVGKSDFMTSFDKAWSLVKELSDYEMAVAEEYSDPRDFMTNRRMRDALGGMPYHEVVRMANHPDGDLDFRYMPRDEQAGQIESLADEDVEAIYNQMMRLKRMARVQDMQGDYDNDHRNQTFLETQERDKRNR